MPAALRHQKGYRLNFPGILSCIFFISAVTSATSLHAQQYLEDSLIRNCQTAKTEVEKIESLGRLSDYYFANKNFSEGDSLIEKQIMLAEATLDQKLITMVLFGNAAYKSTGTSTIDRSKNTKDYIKRALAYARANDLTAYSALAYANLAALNITDGQLDEAFKNASLAFTTALNTDNDSAKVICAIQLGDVYLEKTDFLTAFKTYTNANNLAMLHKDESLLPAVMRAMAELYKRLDKDEMAKTYVFRGLAIDKKLKNINGQVKNNMLLGKISNYAAARDYLQQAISLADSIEDVKLKIESEKILFFYSLLKEKPSFMMAFLENKPELKKVFLNSGPDYLNWMMAEIFLYGGMPDTAEAYFKKAESSFNSGYDLTSKWKFFGEFAYCLQQVSNVPAAITYYERTLELARASSNLVNLKNYSKELKNLYQQMGDFKQAFNYSVLFENYKDSVDQMKQEKDLALMEIDVEAKAQARQAVLAEELLQRRYNLQYMIITVIVIAAFVLLIMIGMFKVSTTTIRVAGFLTLIFLFEFIILILDKWIHQITHGEPWKNWLIKIAIISILLPIHHFMEKKIIHYLLSRHLISVRSRISFSALFGKKEKPLPEIKPGEEAIGNLEEKN